MKVVKVNEISEEPVSSELMTPGKVTLQSIDMPKDGNFVMKKVNFGKGVRNKFHTHTSDQILIITGGKGIVATEKEEIIVGPGDVVYLPRGEKHWHGATPESDFSHFYITASGYKTTQLEE